MESIDIAYKINIEGYIFKETDFSDTTPEFKNIKLKPIDTNIGEHLILIKKNVSSTNQNELKAVFSESILEAEKFVYVFSYVAGIKIYGFECKGYYKDDKLISSKNVFREGSLLSFSAKLTLNIGERRIKNIKKKMKEDYDLPLLQLFYDSATIREPVSRFISLYTLLLHRCSDKQKSVDKAIISIDPTVSQFKSPKNKGYETIFTKLRNELSHKRKNVNILKTHNEIRMNIDRLEQIVKSFIFK